MSTLAETLELIGSFQHLPNGWHFGSGIASSQEALRESAQMVLVGSNIEEAEAFPGTDGEIQVNFYKGDATLEMIFECDGTITLTLDKDNGSVRLGKGLGFNRAAKILKEFESDPCRLFASSTSRSTTVISISDLLVWPSAHRVTAEESPFSKKVAAKNRVGASAYISRNTMRPSSERLSSFGKSLIRKSQKTVIPSLA